MSLCKSRKFSKIKTYSFNSITNLNICMIKKICTYIWLASILGQSSARYALTLKIEANWLSIGRNRQSIFRDSSPNLFLSKKENKFPQHPNSTPFLFFFEGLGLVCIITGGWQPIRIFLWIDSQFASFSKDTSDSPLSSNVVLSVQYFVWLNS